MPNQKFGKNFELDIDTLHDTFGKENLVFQSHWQVYGIDQPTSGMEYINQSFLRSII
jgi:hypothetical protein